MPVPSVRVKILLMCRRPCYGFLGRDAGATFRNDAGSTVGGFGTLLVIGHEWAARGEVAPLDGTLDDRSRPALVRSGGARRVRMSAPGEGTTVCIVMPSAVTVE